MTDQEEMIGMNRTQAKPAPQPGVSRTTVPGRLRSLTVGGGPAAVPLQLGGTLKDWLEALDLESFRGADPRQIASGALADQRLPHRRLDIINAGHFAWEEAANEYVELVASWWDEGGT